LRYENFDYSFSKFEELSASYRKQITQGLKISDRRTIDILAYCLMPTHIHLVLKQKRDGAIAQYMMRLLNCYSKYFNAKHLRCGPLWSSRFKGVSIKNDEQLLHLTRYLHLNPTSAGLVENPEDWKHSSYNEYLNKKEVISTYKDTLNIDQVEYRNFVCERKGYQKSLSKIKSLLIENYSG
jgi:putative transposase